VLLVIDLDFQFISRVLELGIKDFFVLITLSDLDRIFSINTGHVGLQKGGVRVIGVVLEIGLIFFTAF